MDATYGETLLGLRDCALLLLAYAAVWSVADRLAVLGVPFVFATGYGEHCDRGLHAAAPVRLAKSIDPGALFAVVEDLAAGK